MTEKKEILAIKKTSNVGRPVTTGSKPGSKYNTWLEAQGLDKKTILDRMTKAETVGQIAVEIEKRLIALNMAGLINDAAAEYYNSNKNRDLELNKQLQQVDVNIKNHEMKELGKDPEYSPINDKQLLRWYDLRSKLMEMIRKQQMELTKMATDKDSVVSTDDVNWDNI